MDERPTRSLRPKGRFEGNRSAESDQPPSEAQYRALIDGEVKFSKRYEDVELLGQGGMGEVRLCIDRRTERTVAVKRIDKERRGQRERQRFLREARIQAQLDHPNIVPVYDIGVDDDGLEYFTMKRAVGATFEEILDGLRRGDPNTRVRYPLAARLAIFRQVLHAVEYAHARGILHRDLKPANVIVGERSETYVIDWGIAKIVRGDTKGASLPPGRGSGLGTPGYLAPEQSVDADSVDVRADVYALGAILFELLTLEPFHKGSDIEALLNSTQLGQAEASVSARRPDLEVAPELERVCVLALKTNPAERLSTVGEFIAVVAGYLDGDRDLALRRELAQRHADAAMRAYVELEANDDPDGTLRVEALREAGRALALNAESSAAIDVITRLMAHPPSNIPEEARATLQQEENAAEAAARGQSIWYYLPYIPILTAWFALANVHNWLAVAAVFIPLLFAIGITAVDRFSDRHREAHMYSIGAVLVAISASACFDSPYVMMPALLAGFASAAFAASDAAMRRPLLWSMMCFAAAAVPMALEALGLLPVNVSIERDSLLITLGVFDTYPAATYVALVVINLMAVLMPMAFAYKTARRLYETRARLLLHVWHLRQLTSA